MQMKKLAWGVGLAVGLMAGSIASAQTTMRIRGNFRRSARATASRLPQLNATAHAHPVARYRLAAVA